MSRDNLDPINKVASGTLLSRCVKEKNVAYTRARTAYVINYNPRIRSGHEKLNGLNSLVVKTREPVGFVPAESTCCT